MKFWGKEICIVLASEKMTHWIFLKLFTTSSHIDKFATTILELYTRIYIIPLITVSCKQLTTLSCNTLTTFSCNTLSIVFRNPKVTGPVMSWLMSLETLLIPVSPTIWPLSLAIFDHRLLNPLTTVTCCPCHYLQ